MQRIFNKREKVFVFLAFGVVISSIGFNLLIAPVLKKNDALNREISINKARLNRYTRLLNQKEYIEEKYGEFAPGVSLSEESREARVSVLSELETLSEISNIRIIDLRPEAYRSQAAHAGIDIDLRTEGAMEEYLKFIYDIESSPFLLRIKRLQLNTRPNSPLLEGVFSISQLSSPD